jgi:hypothetical protein
MDEMLKCNRGWFCSIEHMQEYGSKKAKIIKDKQERKDHNKAKKNLRESSKKWMMNKTKELCHKYIRARDKDLPCISCGSYEGEIDSTGWDHIWDAGHFLSRGSHPELRFEELNIHKQCVKCNTAPNIAGQSRTVKEGYRESIIRKIGIEKVEWLEGPHPIPTRTIEDLKEIQNTYKLKIKELDNVTN